MAEEDRLKFSLGYQAPVAAPAEEKGDILDVASLDQFNQHMMLTVRAVNQMKSIFTVRGS